jgi:hypothetical protein
MEYSTARICANQFARDTNSWYEKEKSPQIMAVSSATSALIFSILSIIEGHGLSSCGIEPPVAINLEEFF